MPRLEQGPRPFRRLLGAGIAVAFLAAACSGGGASTAPSTAPSEPAASQPAASEGAGGSAAPSADVIADLKAKLNGQSLKVGSSASPNASVVGFFKTLQLLEQDFGVQVDEQLLDSDPLIAAMISEQVQVGQLSLAGTANANANGANFVAFGVNDQKNPFIVAAKDPTKTLEDLRGKPFGATSNLNQITGQTGRKCLESAGMDIEKDVQLIQFNNTGEVTGAIRSGQVAGGISATFRLTGIKLEEPDNIINILCYGKDENPQISSVWMADRDWVAANPDMAQALIISELNAARWSKVSKDEWIALAMEVIEGYSPEAGALDYQDLVIDLDDWPVNGGLDETMCQQTLDTSFEFGAITAQLQCSDVADFSFQEKALEILGEQ
jgi:ABC-type nitrate/sulfonate/bicarbonate transport system substrate-binding protein